VTRADPSAVLSQALGDAVARVVRHCSRIRSVGGEPEDVHQARLGIRRFRTQLKEFRTLFDSKWSQTLRKEAKTLADALGHVRDADVVLARLQDNLSALTADDRQAAQEIVDRLQADRDAAHDRLLSALRDPGYAQLLEDMVSAAREPLFAGGTDRSSDSLLNIAEKAFAKLKATVESFATEPSSSDLHRVRILTKRARYVTETLIPAAGTDAARFAKRASALQDVLGELQDATVAGDWLKGVAESTPAAFLAGVFAGMEVVACREATAQWRPAWDRLDRKSVTAWLSG
jgi:CHAD domain-containing protein